MPASPSVVELNQAKAWAKRLLKATPALESLSQAQEAVAKMLGHASWHALVAFYAHRKPSERDASPHTPHTSSRNPDDAFSGVLRLINERFPGINATVVETLAHESEEVETGQAEIIDRFFDLERSGHFPEYALEMALKESTQSVHAPPGHLMVRVRNQNNKAMMVVLGVEEYRQVSGF